MAINQEYPVLDGIAPSWADVTVKLALNGGALVDMIDIAAIKTGRSVEVGPQKGASGGRVITRTTGEVSQEASITFYRSGYQKALREMMAVAPVRGNQRLISLVFFDINWQMTPPGSVEIYERRVKGCRFIGDTMESAEGSDAQQVEVPLSVLVVADVIDGVEVVLL